jgi:hypothetical protein
VLCPYEGTVKDNGVRLKGGRYETTSARTFHEMTSLHKLRRCGIIKHRKFERAMP